MSCAGLHLDERYTMRNFEIDSLHCFSNEEFEKMAADASELAKRRVYGGVGQYFPGGSYLTAEEVAKKINLGRRGDTPTTICTWDGFWKGAMPSPYRTIREFLRGWKTVDEDHRTGTVRAFINYGEDEIKFVPTDFESGQTFIHAELLDMKVGATTYDDGPFRLTVIHRRTKNTFYFTQYDRRK